MLRDLKWKIHVGNGTVLTKNREINYCSAAVEDTDHLARAFRKYPRNSNITSKDLGEAGYSVSYSSQWHITTCRTVWRVSLLNWTGGGLGYISGYAIKLTERQLSGSGDPGCWICVSSTFCKWFKMWNRFLREKKKQALFWELYLQEPALWHKI